MRVSEYYKLAETQPTLEFVDVDVYGDTRLFVDPRALRDLDESDWAKECVSLLQDFFDNVMQAIQTGDHAKAKRLLSALHEPNETHLGVSKNKAKGHAVADGLAEDVWQSLSQSRAATTGFLEDLEDTALFVEGVGFDVISDITTNIIRSQLIKFTGDVCRFYGIELHTNVASGRLWDRHSGRWKTEFVELPVTDSGPLILVPKSIVRRRYLSFDPGEYFNHWVLPSLQEEELGAGSSLVEVLKNGRRRVTKKSLKEKYGVTPKDENTGPRPSKQVSLEATVRHPEILDDYRSKKERPTPSLSHELMTESTDAPLPDWDALLNKVINTPTGNDDATTYHRSVEALLKALFWPALDFDKREFPINGGRKRIDITFNNIAHSGFFDWVNRVAMAPAPQVYIECKNYGREIGNPELDQLAGRFSDIRGRLGFLTYRGFVNKANIIQSCRDTALAGNGFIIALDDNDLKLLVAERKQNHDNMRFDLLMRRYQELV